MVFSLSGTPVYCLAWSPDSKQLVFTNGKHLVIKGQHGGSKPIMVSMIEFSKIKLQLQYNVICLLWRHTLQIYKTCVK